MKVYAVVDLRPTLDYPKGETIETFMEREAAEHFLARLRDDRPELATALDIEERQIETRLVSRRGGCLIALVGLVGVLLALVIWWLATFELLDDMGLF